MIKRMVLMASMVAMMAPLFAAETASVWKGETELGFLVTSGNTETEKYSARVKVENERDKWRHLAELKSLMSKETDVATDVTTTSAKKYELTAKSDYKFRVLDYVFAVANYEDDRFSGYDYRASLAAGYGRRVLHQENLKLDIEAGPGVRKSRTDAGVDDNQGMLRLSGKLAWIISKTAKFNQELTSELGTDVNITRSISSLRNQINGDLSSVLTITVKNVSSVPVGVEETDTETALALVYSF